jgi:hypothetical protein
VANSASIASQHRQVTLMPWLPPVALNVPAGYSGRLVSLLPQPACSTMAIT